MGGASIVGEALRLLISDANRRHRGLASVSSDPSSLSPPNALAGRPTDLWESISLVGILWEPGMVIQTFEPGSGQVSWTHDASD